ncbi:MAG: hypothetical protein SVR94_05145 [Pseudomonadota bacterium]|nr:hypothetical protein [Pseudomonadota bacterium]
MALYNNTNGDNWNQQQGWLSEPQVADWHGVTVFNQHVVGLQLSTNNLDGSLPAELCDLTQLAHLSMGLNLLNGALPDCLGNLSQLQLLYLSQNAFLNGTLPASLSQLTQLKQLYLDGNEFQGPLPSAFVDMALNSTALVQFNFFKNNFGAEDCQAVNALIDRGGWIETLPGWEDVSNGFMHSTQNDGFNFEQDCAAATNELMITKVGNGTVSGDGIDCGTTCVQTYEPNTPVTLTASAAIDHLFSHWSNSCADQTDNPLTIIMDADKICTAHFELKPASFCSQVTDITQAQCEVLEALYYNNGGNTWNDNTGWLTDTTVNNWSGVTVSAGQVSKLELVDNNLIGSLSPALCELQQLQVIKLDDNPNLTGSLPGCIGSILSQLEMLSIANSLTEDNDGLNGGIPASLCQLTALKTLRLQGNQFSGAIPNCFDTLTQLTELGLHHNQLSGNLPDTLCELTQLTHLGLGHNQLNGTLPPCIGDKPLLQLELLYLSDNQFSGAVPESFRNLINLKQLYLDQNQFDSPIANTLGQMLLASPHLIQLNLQQNNLGAEDCTLITALIDKDIWVETLPGWENIGQGFQHSPQNNDFDFTQDCVTTPPPTEYPLTLTKTGTGSITSDDGILNCGSTCQQNYAENATVVLTAHADAGATFSHWGDDCSGETTEEATVIMNEAKTCSAHFEAVAPPPPPPPVFTCNAITDIPQAECAALSNFYAQTDGDNWNEHSGWLTETTAAQWQGITVTDGHVTALELAENNLSGTVPAAIGDLIELTTLNLAQNTLQSNLPAEFCQLIQLTQLTLNDNQLNGSIPTCIGGGFLNLQQLNLANNQLSGTIPQALSNLNSLQQLYLGNNELTGPLTEAFTNLAQLTHLTLNSNHFGVDSCGAVHQLMERDPPWALLLHSPQKEGFDFQNDCVFVSLNTLSVASEGPGKIEGDGIDCGTDCVQTFDTGAIEVNLEAIHQDDAIFLNWTGDCTGTEPKIEVIMNDDKTCTAHFQQQDVPPPLETTTINLTKTGSGRGTVRGKLKGSKTWSLNCLTECTETNHDYDAQSEIILTARPLKGFEFKGWGQDCPGEATRITLTLDAPNKNCTAEFIPDANAQQLTVESAGPGSITAPWLNCSDNCATYYRHERKVRLTAIPNDSALFLGWQGDCQGLNNRFTLTMDTDKTCTAQFQTHNPDETLTLTVNKSGNGRGNLRVIAKNEDAPFLCGPDCLNAHQDYTSGEQLTLVAKPMEHFIFTHWEGDCSGTDPRIKLIMNESKDCTAYFDLDPNATLHTLTVHIIGTGSGRVSARQWSGTTEACQLGCTIYYPAEQKFRLKAHEAPFSTFAGWSGDCSGQRQGTPIVMTEDKTCSANFQSDFEVISNNIIDIFYAEAQLQDGDLTTHYPRSANEACLRETFWLSTLSLMHADQHRQISQTWPEQFNDIEWYTPLAADYCTRSIKTMSGEYIDIEVKLKTQANSEELAHVIIHYLEEQPNVDERPVIFFERSTFTQW